MLQDVSSSAADADALAGLAARHPPLTRTDPLEAIVQRWFAAEVHVSMAMSDAESAVRHLPSRWSRICPAGPRPLARASCQRNEPVASAAPDPSLTCTFTVYWPLIDGQPEISPQVLIARPRGSPDAENRSVQPGSPSVAGIWYRTGLPTDPVCPANLPSRTWECTSQLKFCVALGSPGADAVTDIGNAPAEAGSVPVMAPEPASIVAVPGRPVALKVAGAPPLRALSWRLACPLTWLLWLPGAASSSAVLLSQLASKSPWIAPGSVWVLVYCQ